jgi:gentisate 1,2-dioxygenase
MQGNGADTIVDCEQYAMNEGDLVLTPSWTCHDHEHKGAEPMIWLDVLDISLVRSLDEDQSQTFSCKSLHIGCARANFLTLAARLYRTLDDLQHSSIEPSKCRVPTFGCGY